MTVRILHGDCREVLRGLPDNSVDSIVTDPPYGLTANKKGGSGVASVNMESPYGRARIGTGNGPGGFMGMKWDSDVPPVEVWAECLRVLKPGGYLLAFAGTRTQHRMCCRIEDAGFEIRDLIAWVYGSGFPKSLDVSKAIDKAAGAEREKVRVAPRAATSGTMAGASDSRPWIEKSREVGYHEVAGDVPVTAAAAAWQGWGTALKPALEPITVARKPLIGTVAENVLAHGTGAINVDGCRVGTEGGTSKGSKPQGAGKGIYGAGLHGACEIKQLDAGRWPANLIHDGSDEVVALFPADAGAQAPVTVRNGDKFRGTYGAFKGNRDEQGSTFQGDAGSAARFFYCAKADRADRNDGGANNTHPTVKPTDLMRYLCRLVTPPGGTVLDPFMGSGSTLKAAELEGFSAIGIEIDADYIAIARRRIAADAPLFAEVQA